MSNRGSVPVLRSAAVVAIMAIMAIMAAFYANPALSQTTVTWTTGNSSVLSNWSSGSLPGVNDTVVVGAAGGSSVTLNSAIGFKTWTWGGNGNGTLTIVNGGAVTIDSGTGSTGTSNAKLTVVSQTNSTATLINASSFTVRNLSVSSTSASETAHFTIQSGLNVVANGGATPNGAVIIASTADRSGRLTVSGSLTGAPIITLGASTTSSGSATLVLDGGVITNGNSLVRDAGGSATFQFKSGTFSSGGNSVQIYSKNTSPLDIALGSSGSRIVDTGSGLITVMPSARFIDLTSGGSLTKNGTGTLVLQGTNTYTGDTVISSGTLRVENVAQQILSGTVGGTGNKVISGLASTAGLFIGQAVAGSGITVNSYITALTGTSVTLSGSGTPGAISATFSAANGALEGTTLNYDNQGGFLSFGQSSALTLGGLEGLQNLALTNAASAAVALTLGGNNQSTTYSGTLAGGGSLTKLGAGTLTLSGNNSFSGGATISLGQLTLGHANALGTGTATVNGGVLAIGAYAPSVAGFTISSGSLTGASKLTASTYSLGGGTVSANLGGGTVNVTGNSTLNGTSDATTVNLNAGALTLGGGGTRFTSSSVAVSGSSGASLTLGGNESFGSLAGAANIALGANTLSVGSGNTSTTYSGTLAGGGSLTKLGAGTLTLSGNNSFSGGATISLGQLTLGHANALGTGTATVNGGVLAIGAYAPSVAGFTISSGSLTGAGKLTASTYSLGGGTVSANLGGGTVNVTGNSTLNGTSDATTVNLNAGALTLGGGGTRFTSSSVALSGSSGASLVLGGNESFGSLAGAANIALGASMLSVGSGNTSTTYAGNISGSGVVKKVGAGTLTLTGSSSYAGGTTVEGGLLSVNGQIGGNATVLAGGTLGGSGSVGGTLSGAGLVSPGNSPGILTASQFDPSAGLGAAFEFTSLTPVYTSATASLNDVLRLTNASNPFASSTFTSANVIDVYFNVGSIVGGQTYEGGFFTGLSAADLFAALDGKATFHYWAVTTATVFDRSFNGSDYVSLTSLSGITGATFKTADVTRTFGSGVGNVTGSVTQFVIVPEPGSLALAGIGIAAAGWSFWNRRRHTP